MDDATVFDSSIQGTKGSYAATVQIHRRNWLLAWDHWHRHVNPRIRCIICQLTLYPSVNARFGLLKAQGCRSSSFQSRTPLRRTFHSSRSSRSCLWLGIVVVVILQIGARTFAIPGSVLLINNSSPSPALLGTIHGMGAATSSAFRTVGPIVCGHWYSQGLEKGMVGLAWWCLALMSLIGVFPSFWRKMGNKMRW